MALAGSWNHNNYITTGGTTTTQINWQPIVATYQPEPVKRAEKKTAIDWLNDQIESMCSIAREALPA